MKKSRFSEEQIIRVLQEHQAGATAADLCRKQGISDATFYNWRSKYGGMEVSDAKKLKGLESENAKLKKLLAEQMMDVATLKEMLGKTFEARFKEKSGGLGHHREELFAAAGLHSGRDRSAGLSAQIDTAGRYRSAYAAKGAIQRTTPVWLSAPAHSAEARGLGCELKEAVSHLP